MLKTNDYLVLDETDKTKIEGYFKHIAEKVKNTLELKNVILTYNSTPIDTSLSGSKDEEERNWLLNVGLNRAIDLITEDRDTRKAVFYNLYESGLEYNCLNVFHLYYRNGELDLNVYVRSMNYDTNFAYDSFTFQMILQKASEKLNLKMGKVLLHIMSLHKFLNE